jgi:hypothetical protein
MDLPSPSRFTLRIALLAMILAAPMSLRPEPARAQDASFGCKVLLCALARNPSWGGIPYCVPVMTAALQLLRKGRGFPPCAEAQARYGHEPHEPCPANFTPRARDGGSGEDVCARPKPASAGCVGGDGGCAFTATHDLIERKTRAEPYYVETRGESGAPIRSYFSLR